MSTPTLNEIMELIRAFRTRRNWEPFHAPKNLAFSIAIEAAELLEIFQWADAQESISLMEDTEFHAAAADELADILIYCLYFADQAGIDPLQAIADKMKLNENRFPVPPRPELPTT
jgi:dCTP diphosphatase